MKTLKKIPIIFLILLGSIWLYTNSLIGVDVTAKKYLYELKHELKELGYQPNLFVSGGRRYKLDNYLLNKYAGGAKNSLHLKGKAIDLIILDVNKDGKRNSKDIVYRILDKKIIGNKGGLGSYKNVNGFLSRQMIHFDSRGYKARRNR